MHVTGQDDIPGLAARRAALALVMGVRDGKPIDPARVAHLPPGERARALALADGALRHRTALDARIAPYLAHPPSPRAALILRLLALELTGNVAAHGAVHVWVELTKSAAKDRKAAGMINAIGRKLARDTAPFAPAPQRLPKGLRTAFSKAWGRRAVEQMEAVFAAPAPVDLTVRGDAQDWAAQLGGTVLPGGSVRLAGKGQLSALPGFATGDWWVQDAAAAFPARMLGDVKGARVLDLCAAPGGKTMQLAAAGAEVTALDCAEDRLDTLRANLKRTKLSAGIVCADALGWTPDAPFDAILLDAPCSATGTIRRHPDLPLLRQTLELAPVLALQKQLLERALGWLAPQGRLVYCTCSLLPEEGEAQVASHSVTAPPEGMIPLEFLQKDCLRTRPDLWAAQGGIDGFFAALIAP